MSENTHCSRWKDQCTAGLQLNKIIFYKIENMFILVCSEQVQSKLVKLETCCRCRDPALSGECSLPMSSNTFLASNWQLAAPLAANALKRDSRPSSFRQIFQNKWNWIQIDVRCKISTEKQIVFLQTLSLLPFMRDLISHLAQEAYRY